MLLSFPSFPSLLSPLPSFPSSACKADSADTDLELGETFCDLIAATSSLELAQTTNVQPSDLQAYARKDAQESLSAAVQTLTDTTLPVAIEDAYDDLSTQVCLRCRRVDRVRVILG